MGRKAMTLDKGQKAEVETLAAVLTTDQIADYFGIGRTTFFAMMQRDAEIAERYKKGKARAIGAIAQGLIAKARGGDTASMIFYLKTQGGWRETAGLELSGPQGGEIPVPSPMTKLVEMLDEIAARKAAGAPRVRLEAGATPAVAQTLDRAARTDLP